MLGLKLIHVSNNSYTWLMFLVHVKPTINKVYSSKEATGRVWTKSSGRNHTIQWRHMGAMAFHITGISTVVRAYYKENTTVPQYWHCMWWVSTGDQWIPITKDPWVYYGRTQQIEGMRLGICCIQSHTTHFATVPLFMWGRNMPQAVAHDNNSVARKDSAPKNYDELLSIKGKHQ